MTLVASAASRRRWGGWPGLAALVALCLAVYLPGFFSLPPVDRDEARFAQASRQMAESGDYIVPRVLGKPRLNKPPLIYWLQSASARIFTRGELTRDAIWMYRVPSLLAAITAVVLTWRLGCALFDPRAGFLGAALFAIAPIMFWESHQARADMLMVAFTTAAIWLLWEVLRRPTFPRVFGLWAAVGFGVLAKGPMTPLIIVLGAGMWCVLHRRWRDAGRTNPLLGVLVLAAMVGPWVYLVAAQVGFSQYLAIIADETLGRSVEAKEGHGYFPGFHTLAVNALLFPGSLWLGAGLWRAWVLGVRPRTPSHGGLLTRFIARLGSLRAARPQECFLLCVTLPAWVVVECMSTRLPHYTMPMLPALALIAARASLSVMPSMKAWLDSRWIAASVRVWNGIGPIIAFAAAALGWLAARDGAVWGWAVLAVGAGAGLMLAIEGHALITSRDYRELLVRAIKVGVVSLVLVGLTLPRVKEPWVVFRAVEAAHAADPGLTRPLAFVGLIEDSAVYLTRGRAVWLDADQLNEWVRVNPNGLVVVPGEQASAVHGFAEIARVAGLNYSNGRRGEWALIGRVE